MKIFYAATPFEQVAIEGSCADYLKLAEVVKSGGKIEFNNSADPSPYDSFLSAVEVKVLSDSKVLVQVGSGKLRIEGNAESLKVLAENMAEFGIIEADVKLHQHSAVKYHQHIDYYEGHFFLAEGSVEIILEHE